MREYQRSHPWLTFEIDLRKVSPDVWILLGQAQSKCLHISRVPLKPALQTQLNATFLAKGVHSTTAIEGNTLSEEEVEKRIAGQLPLPEGREYLGREVDNILEGYNLVRKEILSNGTDGGISPNEVKNYNRIILQNLPVDEHVVPGMIRSVSVGVMHYRGAPADDCEYLLSKMADWLNRPELRSENNPVVLGILRAILAHLYLAWIHPFADGNGRTARLLELKILISAGVPAPAAHLLSNHYNLTRNEYYRQLDYASKSGGDIFKFIEYAVKGLVEGLQSQLEFIHFAQVQIFWSDYVYEKFGSSPKKIDLRRRRLALDLAEGFRVWRLDEIRELSPKVAQAYAGKTTKTIQRDLDALKVLGLVGLEDGGFRANLSVLSQFFAGALRK